MDQHTLEAHCENDSIDESEISQTIDSSMNESNSLHISINELSTNCSTPKRESEESLPKKVTRNIKKPLSLENRLSIEKPKTKSINGQNQVNLKDSNRISNETKSTPKSKRMSKQASDTENQSPPKILVESVTTRRKSKILNKSETSEKTETIKSENINPLDNSLKNDCSKEFIDVTDNITMDENIMLQMFYETSTIEEEIVCKVCKQTGNVIQCNGPCAKYYHRHCTNSKILRRNGHRFLTNGDSKGFNCNDCLFGLTPSCDICNKSTQPVNDCFVFNCTSYYHPACIQTWPQSITMKNKSVCPQHVCHTCASKDLLAGKALTVSFEKMHKCIRCYAAYHSSPWCIPAGSLITSADTIICPKHFAKLKPDNFDWCFRCSQAEATIKCLECPVAYHRECLDDDECAISYLCKNCKSGKLPLHNEVVWVKVNFSCECWPAVVCTNANIPSSLLQTKYQGGEFCVHYIEANKYEYVNRERIIPFEGDLDVKIVKLRVGVIDDVLSNALANALTLSKQFKLMSKKKSTTLALPEPKYEPIEVNEDKHPERLNKSPTICKCSELSNSCGPKSSCENRTAQVECDKTCPIGNKCENQMLSKRQYLAVEKFVTSDRGWGLRALEPAFCGDFVIEFVGQVMLKKSIKRRKMKSLTSPHSIYYLQVNSKRMIDAEQKGNLSRFINHSCDPNCVVQHWTVNKEERIGIFASRDIRIGEELTISYQVVDLSSQVACLCGTSKCTGLVGFTKEQVQNINSMKINDKSLIIIDSSMEVDTSKDVKSNMCSFILDYKCWKCGQDFTNLMNIIKCENCDKQYHASCIEPNEKNLSACPWHFCKICKQKTQLHCHLCSSAYCASHSENNLFLQKDNLHYQCNKHNIRKTRRTNIDDRNSKRDRKTM